MTSTARPTFSEDERSKLRATAVRRYLALRRKRSALIEGNLFSDPSWDMLLDLYAATLEGRVESISSICIASMCPSTTGLRHLTALIAMGYVAKTSDRRDRRRHFVSLTAQSRGLLDTWVDEFIDTMGFAQIGLVGRATKTKAEFLLEGNDATRMKCLLVEAVEIVNRCMGC